MPLRRLSLVLLMMAAAAPAQERWEVTIDGRERWKDTGITVEAGDLIRFEASGKLKFPEARAENGAEGVPGGWRGLVGGVGVNVGAEL